MKSIERSLDKLTEIDQEFSYSLLPLCQFDQMVYYASNGKAGTCLTLGSNLTIVNGVINAAVGATVTLDSCGGDPTGVSDSTAAWVNCLFAAQGISTTPLATITSGSIAVDTTYTDSTYGKYILTATAANSFSANNTFMLGGFTTSAGGFLNYQNVTILTANSTSFTAVVDGMITASIGSGAVYNSPTQAGTVMFDSGGNYSFNPGTPSGWVLGGGSNGLTQITAVANCLSNSSGVPTTCSITTGGQGIINAAQNLTYDTYAQAHSTVTGTTYYPTYTNGILTALTMEGGVGYGTSNNWNVYLGNTCGSQINGPGGATAPCTSSQGVVITPTTLPYSLPIVSSRAYPLTVIGNGATATGKFSIGSTTYTGNAMFGCNSVTYCSQFTVRDLNISNATIGYLSGGKTPGWWSITGGHITNSGVAMLFEGMQFGYFANIHMDTDQSGIIIGGTFGCQNASTNNVCANAYDIIDDNYFNSITFEDYHGWGSSNPVTSNNAYYALDAWYNTNFFNVCAQGPNATLNLTITCGAYTILTDQDLANYGATTDAGFRGIAGVGIGLYSRHTRAGVQNIIDNFIFKWSQNHAIIDAGVILQVNDVSTEGMGYCTANYTGGSNWIWGSYFSRACYNPYDQTNYNLTSAIDFVSLGGSTIKVDRVSNAGNSLYDAAVGCPWQVSSASCAGYVTTGAIQAASTRGAQHNVANTAVNPDGYSTASNSLTNLPSQNSGNTDSGCYNLRGIAANLAYPNSTNPTGSSDTWSICGMDDIFTAGPLMPRVLLLSNRTYQGNLGGSWVQAPGLILDPSVIGRVAPSGYTITAAGSGWAVNDTAAILCPTGNNNAIITVTGISGSAISSSRIFPSQGGSNYTASGSSCTVNAQSNLITKAPSTGTGATATVGTVLISPTQTTTGPVTYFTNPLPAGTGGSGYIAYTDTLTLSCGATFLVTGVDASGQVATASQQTGGTACSTGTFSTTGGTGTGAQIAVTSVGVTGNPAWPEPTTSLTGVNPNSVAFPITQFEADQISFSNTASAAANSCSAFAAVTAPSSVTGLQVNATPDVLNITPPSSVYPVTLKGTASNGTITITACNPTSSAVTLPSGIYAIEYIGMGQNSVVPVSNQSWPAPTTTAIGVATSTPWSGITNPTGNLALTMPTNNQTTMTWTSGARTGTNYTWTAGDDTGAPSADAFAFTDTASDTATGNLVHIFTAASSTANPLQICNQGTTACWTFTQSTNTLTASGSALINANRVNSNTFPTSAAAVSTAVAFWSSTSSLSGGSTSLTWSSPVLSIGTAGSLTGCVTLNSSTATGGVKLCPASAASLVTVTVPALTDTLVNLTGTQTLTNKTVNGAQLLSGATASITGTALTATCDSGTATVTGAIVGHPVAVSSTTGADIGGAFNIRGSVTSTNTVTVYVCGTGTPASLAYNVVVF